MDAPTIFSSDWWQQPLGTWMAWNRVSIAFFLYIFGSIAAMGVWEYFSPGGNPRHGIVRAQYDTRRSVVHDASGVMFHFPWLARAFWPATMGWAGDCLGVGGFCVSLRLMLG